MAGAKRDYLHECLSDPALAAVSNAGPEAFMAKACRVCRNVECIRNPTNDGERNSWLERMRDQKVKLLDDPQFGDVSDPRFDHLRQTEWRVRLREAIAVQLATAKGDWSVPTEAEVNAVMGEQVRPPERLIDEVRVIPDVGDKHALPPPAQFEPVPVQVPRWACPNCGHVVESETMPEWCPSCRGQEAADTPARTPDAERKVEEAGEVEVKVERAKTGRAKCRQCGSNITIGSQRLGRYEMDQMVGKAVWQWFHSECAETYFPEDLARARTQGAAPKPPPSPNPSARAPQPVAPNAVPVSRTTPPAPPAPTTGAPSMNTPPPRAGVLLGGAPPPNQPEADPWSYPAGGPQPKAKVVAVGGTVRMGGGDEEKK